MCNTLGVLYGSVLSCVKVQLCTGAVYKASRSHEERFEKKATVKVVSNSLNAIQERINYEFSCLLYLSYFPGLVCIVKIL